MTLGRQSDTGVKKDEACRAWNVGKPRLEKARTLAGNGTWTAVPKRSGRRWDTTHRVDYCQPRIPYLRS